MKNYWFILSLILSFYVVSTQGIDIKVNSLAKDRWKVLSFSSENTKNKKYIASRSFNTANHNNSASRAVDGSSDTYWHTEWNVSQPEHLHHIAMSEVVNIDGFTY